MLAKYFILWKIFNFNIIKFSLPADWNYRVRLIFDILASLFKLVENSEKTATWILRNWQWHHKLIVSHLAQGSIVQSCIDQEARNFSKLVPVDQTIHRCCFDCFLLIRSGIPSVVQHVPSIHWWDDQTLRNQAQETIKQLTHMSVRQGQTVVEQS